MRHKSRTLYSIFGIIITFIMCFAVLTTGYSLWDYLYQLSDGENIQLWAYVYSENEDGEVQGATEEMISQIQALEQCEEVERLWVYDTSWQNSLLESSEEEEQNGEEYIAEGRHLCKTTELEPGHSYDVGIKLKDLSNLQNSAESLQDQCGLEIMVDSDVEEYLGQGDSTFKNFYQAIETILATIIALFCIMILRNTMMISVVERMKDYGIYRCVGMSRKQLYQVLAMEGLCMSLVAVVCGVGAGYGLLQLITPWLNHALSLDEPFHFGFYYQAVFITALLCVGVTLYALLEPSRQAGQLSPIEAIRNNIVLRNRNGKLMENLSYHQSNIWGRIFGVSGEYAYKNMRRSRGRFSGLFVSLLVCMTIMGIMESVSESLYATVSNIYQGKNKKYLESVYPSGEKYNDKLAEQIQKDIADIEVVQDTGIVMWTDDIYWRIDPVLAEYTDESSVGYVSHTAYDREDIEYLKKYLIAGSIDYDKMVREQGVLLCDMKHNEESIQTDFNQEDVRMTNYQVGDRIRRLNAKGIQWLGQIYNGTLDQIAENLGIPKQEPRDDQDSLYPDLEYCRKDDEKFEQYRQEFLRILKKQDIHLDPQRTEEIRDISSFWGLLSRWIFGQESCSEYLTEYVIQGIISEDAVYGRINPGITFIHTIDTVKQVAEIDNIISAPTDDYWSWFIVLFREPDVMMGKEIERYCLQQKQYSLAYSSYFDDSDGEYTVQNYLDMLHTMGMVRVISVLFIVCIATICMIQLYNTLCANLAIRRKELRLYQLVGMGGRQMRKMLLLEHIAATVLAVIAGYFLAWAASWYFIEYLLNENGNVMYTWSGLKVAVMGIGVILITCLICLLGIRSTRKQS